MSQSREIQNCTDGNELDMKKSTPEDELASSQDKPTLEKEESHVETNSEPKPSEPKDLSIEAIIKRSEALATTKSITVNGKKYTELPSQLYDFISASPFLDLVFGDVAARRRLHLLNKKLKTATEAEKDAFFNKPGRAYVPPNRQAALIKAMQEYEKMPLPEKAYPWVQGRSARSANTTVS